MSFFCNTTCKKIRGTRYRSNGAPIRRGDSLLLNVCLAIMIITDIDARNYSFPFFIAQFIAQRLIIISVFIARFVAQILLNPRRKKRCAMQAPGSYVHPRGVLNGCIAVTLSDAWHKRPAALANGVLWPTTRVDLSSPSLVLAMSLSPFFPLNWRQLRDRRWDSLSFYEERSASRWNRQ